MTKLECPSCHSTLDIPTWNENLKLAVHAGWCDELIPENLQPDGWEIYFNEHSGRVDCPECEENVPFCDMVAY